MSKYITNKDNPNSIINLDEIVEVSVGEIIHSATPYLIYFWKDFTETGYNYWSFSEESIRDGVFEDIKGTVRCVEVSERVMPNYGALNDMLSNIRY
jgi:hypothetical protein